MQRTGGVQYCGFPSLPNLVRLIDRNKWRDTPSRIGKSASRFQDGVKTMEVILTDFVDIILSPVIDFVLGLAPLLMADPWSGEVDTFSVLYWSRLR